MNKPAWLLLLACGLWAAPSAAQQAVPAPKQEYLDEDFVVLPSAEGAHYRRQTEYRDSISGTVRDYFLNGQLQSTCFYEHIRQRTANGAFESWYENGTLASHQEFAHGKPAGERRMYYPSGQLKRHEQYQGDKRTLAECYNQQGQPIAFFEYEIMPKYPEGAGDQRAIIIAIARSIRYPKDALRANVQGRVFVKFIVTKEGNVDKVEVVKGVLPSIDAETVRAVQQLRRFKPGYQDGEAVNVGFTVPVSYSIAPGRTLFGGTTYKVPD